MLHFFQKQTAHSSWWLRECISKHLSFLFVDLWHTAILYLPGKEDSWTAVMSADTPNPEQETLDDIHGNTSSFILKAFPTIKRLVKESLRRKWALNVFYYALQILPSQKPSIEEDVQDIPHFVKQQLLIQPEN